MARLVENTIQFPYRRSLGPALGPFMTALTRMRILGGRVGSRVLVPPPEWDPETADPVEAELVEVGPAATVRLWTWVADPSAQHPLEHPFAFVTLRLDGADNDIVHVVDCAHGEVREGFRVAPRWRARREGRITDIECFVAGEQPVVAAGDAGPGAKDVTMMDYVASITYRNPVPASAEAMVEASARHVLVGHRCPVCGRVYAGGRGYCPVEAVELGAENEVELPARGVVTNYTVVTPVQYPGQTETEPFTRAMVLLDGTDVVLGYQPLLEVPADQVRTGMAVEAVWARPGEVDPGGGGGMGSATGYLIGWRPGGGPGSDDPDLVNRIF